MKYPQELKQRAVRLVFEAREPDPEDRNIVSRISRQLGIKCPETLRGWLRQVDIDLGNRPGVTTEESQVIRP